MTTERAEVQNQDQPADGGVNTPVPATDLRALARELVEFPSIAEKLAGNTRFFLSSQLALATVPQTQLDDVERLQSETAEARLMLDTVGDIGLGGIADPRPLLRRAALGGMLTGAELMQIVSVVESIWLARSVVISMKGRAPRLEDLASEIPDLRPVADRIKQSLSDTGDVVDDATPRLGPLRKKAARAYQRLLSLLERMTARPAIRAALQSSAIAARGDRLVLEVRAGLRNDVPGIVHDVSKTGATIFVEPFRAVEPCNTWRELAAEAQREEERVLIRLSKIIGGREQEATYALEATADLDLMVARARLAASMNGVRAESLPAGDEVSIRLYGARHPLLGVDAVPVNVSIGPGYKGLVITGPNTGGKTVALKTIGLFALMHQCGMQVPALTGTALAVFDGVYADIGDAQSIERSVSTFSSHMGNVVHILGEAGPDSLVLLDELGTGTDPDEGSALARSILSYLLERGIPTAITTHHRAVAEFATSVDGVVNASVELDPTSMLPTYHLVTGIPGRSYALNVASLLGLPQDILAKARLMLDDKHIEAELLLDQLQTERNALRDAAVKTQEELASAAAVRVDLQRRLNTVVRQQEDLVERTRSELRRDADAVRKELRRVAAEARRDATPAEAQRAVNRIRQRVSDPTWFPIAGVDEAKEMAAGQSPGSAEFEDRGVQQGDLVEIKGLNIKASVLAVHGDGTADLRMGNARIQLSANQLRVLEEAEERADDPPADVRVDAGNEASDTDRLDIRGYRVDAAEIEVGRYVDHCALNGMESCEILHGAGTGALRQAVRELLATTPHVVGFGPAPANRGGNGITVVELR